MSQTVLIIEDNKELADYIQLYFERAAFAVKLAYDGETGLGLAHTCKPDLLVLDLMLPRLDGMSICLRLRREYDVPIIMLTAKGKPTDRINGLESGADDYIVKPFDPNELVARAKAVLRRYKGIKQSILAAGRMTLNTTKREVTLDEELIPISQAQFAILTALMQHPNQVLTREQLIELAFNDDFDGFDRAVDTHIRRLRKLIHSNGFQPIQTVYGAGYKFVNEADR